jgi:hypothetical protein
MTETTRDPVFNENSVDTRGQFQFPRPGKHSFRMR